MKTWSRKGETRLTRPCSDPKDFPHSPFSTIHSPCYQQLHKTCNPWRFCLVWVVFSFSFLTGILSIQRNIQEYIEADHEKKNLPGTGRGRDISEALKPHHFTAARDSDIFVKKCNHFYKKKKKQTGVAVTTTYWTLATNQDPEVLLKPVQ